VEPQISGRRYFTAYGRGLRRLDEASVIRRANPYRGVEEQDHPWTNWVGSVSRTFERYFEPTSLADLVDVVARATEEREELQVIGSGWGFEDPSCAATCRLRRPKPTGMPLRRTTGRSATRTVGFHAHAADHQRAAARCAGERAERDTGKRALARPVI